MYSQHATTTLDHSIVKNQSYEVVETDGFETILAVSDEVQASNT